MDRDLTTEHRYPLDAFGISALRYLRRSSGNRALGIANTQAHLDLCTGSATHSAPTQTERILHVPAETSSRPLQGVLEIVDLGAGHAPCLVRGYRACLACSNYGVGERPNQNLPTRQIYLPPERTVLDKSVCNTPACISESLGTWSRYPWIPSESLQPGEWSLVSMFADTVKINFDRSTRSGKIANSFPYAIISIHHETK